MIASTNEFWENQKILNANQKQAISKLATVIAFTRDNRPIIQLDGESQPRKKIYKKLKSCNPVIGDRVQIIDGIIQDGFD